jgi:hypothetical protein
MVLVVDVGSGVSLTLVQMLWRVVATLPQFTIGSSKQDNLAIMYSDDLMFCVCKCAPVFEP